MPLAMFNPCQPCCQHKNTCWQKLCPGIDAPKTLYAKFASFALSDNNLIGKIFTLQPVLSADGVWTGSYGSINCSFYLCWNEYQALIEFNPIDSNYPNVLYNSNNDLMMSCSPFYWHGVKDQQTSLYAVVSDAIFNQSSLGGLLPNRLYLSLVDIGFGKNCFIGQTWPLDWDITQQMWIGQGSCQQSSEVPYYEVQFMFQRIDLYNYRLHIYGSCTIANDDTYFAPVVSWAPFQWTCDRLNMSCFYIPLSSVKAIVTK